MNVAWENELAELLSNLSAVQGELLELLGKKREFLVKSDIEGLQEVSQQEQQIIERLQMCQEHRGLLLERASEEGLPSDSISALTDALPEPERKVLATQVTEAQSKSRLLHHHSLTNWVLVQRTLIHLSQLLEIIATGGRPQPTYGKGKAPEPSGSLVDHAV